jgi:hypothetical protein
MPEMATERRRTRRVPIRLPVRVKGRDPDGTEWEEMTNCDNASAGGVAVALRRPVRIGQVLHLSLPLPTRFRQYDIVEPSYHVYALVRRRTGSPARVGVLFLGRHPPQGSESLPTETFVLPGDAPPGAAERHVVQVLLRLSADQAPGGAAREQRALAENITARTAEVKAALPVAKGTLLVVEEIDGGFKTRAEVRSIAIEKDGQARLSLLLVDDPFPDRMLPATGSAGKES